jgi:branched-chain amino acid transport system permease protein
MDIVNFAHGEFLMLGMYTIYWINKLFGIDPLLALPASTLLGALLGVASYYWFIKYLLRGPAIAQLFGTFGLMLFLQYTAMFLFSADYRMIDKGLLVGKSLSVGPFVFDWTKLAAGILSLIAFAFVYYFINKTKTGKALQATALNKEAASYMGIKTERMNAIAWAIGGATVGTAGGLLVNFYYAYPMVGILFVMIAFACVALGGFGSIKGVFFAGLLIGILEMTFPVFGQIIGSDFLGPHFKFTVVYLAYFIIVVVRPQGLFGWKN